jgi:hypothetical protein
MPPKANSNFISKRHFKSVLVRRKRNRVSSIRPPCSGQLAHKDNEVGIVDEGTTPSQKLVLRTVRAEYTKLAGIPLAFSALSAVKQNLCKSVKSVVKQVQ